MTSLLINKGCFKSPLTLPRSKSYANRALILGSLSPAFKTIHELPAASDVTLLLKALRQIGLVIESDKTSIVIKNSFPQCEGQAQSILTGEGGTTARFLSCLLLRGTKPYELILGDRLKNRPWASFVKLIHELGGRAKLEGAKLSLQGPVTLPSILEVDCSETTQFASGLQMVFPETTIRPVGLKSSESYWNLTRNIIHDFQQNDANTVPIDWSSASYPLAFGALKQEIDLPNLVDDPFQADAKFLQILKQFGSISQESSAGLTVGKFQKIVEVKFDVTDCLDLVPALAFFLAHIPGRHVLSGVGNLVHKESDRLSEVRNLLAKFNRQTELNGENLHITGSSEIIKNPVSLQFPDDHRMVMAGSLFLMLHSGGHISPREAVIKSFPHFFDQVLSNS